jgi:hypothetical protein
MRHHSSLKRNCDVVILPWERFDRNLKTPLTKPLTTTQLPNMSYGKKDEDADLGLVKVDRTQVFQEGSSLTIVLFLYLPPQSS